MPRRRKKSHPVNDFFRRLGFVCIAFACFAGVTALLYIILHMTSFECLSPTLMGFPCPGCNLIQAGAKLLSFDFISAWELNPIVFFITLWVLITAVRYLFRGNFKRVMSFWWILTLLIPWLSIWAYLTFV